MRTARVGGAQVNADHVADFLVLGSLLGRAEGERESDGEEAHHLASS